MFKPDRTARHFPGDWLDKQCLEPITPVPGCSALYNACLYVLGCTHTHIPLRQRTPQSHERQVRILKTSARRGCVLCGHLVRGCNKGKLTTVVNMEYMGGLQFITDYTTPLIIKGFPWRDPLRFTFDPLDSKSHYKAIDSQGISHLRVGPSYKQVYVVNQCLRRM